MKIGVIGDTHGSVTAWKAAYQNFFQDADLILHCGDVLYHGPRNPLPEGYDPKALAGEINSIRNPLVMVKGNCDAEVDQLLLEYPLESPYAHIITPQFKILAHHGHVWAPENLPPKVNGTYNLIISGHTHIPGIQKTGRTVFLNPGSPALPKDGLRTPTVAMIDGPQISLWNLNTRAILAMENI